MSLDIVLGYIPGASDERARRPRARRRRDSTAKEHPAERRRHGASSRPTTRMPTSRRRPRCSPGGTSGRRSDGERRPLARAGRRPARRAPPGGHRRQPRLQREPAVDVLPARRRRSRRAGTRRSSARSARRSGVRRARSTSTCCSGPAINIKRSPLGGRTFEYFSEDPRLTGALAVAYVRGVQSTGVGTSLKHFAVNSQETDRMRVSAEVDDRTLREIYLPGVRARREGGGADHGDERLQRDQRRVLLGEPVAAHRAAARRVGLRRPRRLGLGCHQGPGRGARAGLDLEMPGTGDEGTEAILAGGPRRARSTASLVDASVARLRRLAERTPRPRRGRRSAFDADAHHALARRAAAASVVLLRNEGETLPLRAGSAGRRHRRARRRAAVPGRRQLAREPDPGGHAARRAASARSARSTSPTPPATRRTRPDDGRRGAARRSAPMRRHPPTSPSSSSACTRRTSRRGSTASTSTCPPRTSRSSRRSRPSRRAPSSCSPTAAWSRSSRGTTASTRSSRAGRSGRRSAGRSPTC